MTEAKMGRAAEHPTWVVYWVTEPGQDRWIYVGRTTVLHRRAAQHRSESEWLTPTAVWTATPKMRADLALRLEQYLVATNQPRYNVHLTPKVNGCAVARSPFEGLSIEDTDAVMAALDQASDVTDLKPPKAAPRKPNWKAEVARSWAQFLAEIRRGEHPELREAMRRTARPVPPREHERPRKAAA